MGLALKDCLQVPPEINAFKYVAFQANVFVANSCILISIENYFYNKYFTIDTWIAQKI